MKIGTKSVLFGAHQFLIHPWFVAWAWWQLYGFPFDVRLWVAFFVHDIGYIGSPNMDGPEGEAHVELGGSIMHWVCDRCFGLRNPDSSRRYHWKMFSILHSRFYAKKLGLNPSRLCCADKLSTALEPWWLYLPRVIVTGEINEYMAKAGGMPDSKYNGEKGGGKYLTMNLVNNDARLTLWQKRRYWHERMIDYLRRYAWTHLDGRADEWTPAQMEAIDSSGVWK